MILDSQSDLASYLRDLLSSGRVVFSRDEAAKALKIPTGAFLDAAQRLQRRHQLLRLRHGFYVVVPPQYLSWGAPPPAWFIDDLMHHEGRPYYVGLLKAAELHGATHHAVMEFQVVTDKRLPKIRAGRSVIAFYFRKDVKAVRAGIGDRKTDTGRMKISSVELTALDLVRYPQASGGLDTIMTVLGDLAEKIDSARLASLATAFERSVAQRLGYLLERLGQADRTGALHAGLEARGKGVPWIELEPRARAEVRDAATYAERNERWRVLANRLPEADE